MRISVPDLFMVPRFEGEGLPQLPLLPPSTADPAIRS
jgi:hypothetical protein